jgi:predicted nuclease with TOPRIM domain
MSDKICKNCDNSYHGFGESSQCFCLRCYIHDKSVDEEETCNSFELSCSEKLKQLEQENAKLKEVVNNAMSILSELNNDFDSMEHSYVGKDSDYHKRIKTFFKEQASE